MAQGAFFRGPAKQEIEGFSKLSLAPDPCRSHLNPSALQHGSTTLKNGCATSSRPVSTRPIRPLVSARFRGCSAVRPR